MGQYDLPDAGGHFGPYGGMYVAETLVAALEELKVEYARARNDPAFWAEYRHELKYYVGRPSPIYHARRWSERLGGAQIYLKREDLNHTGAHKINNTIGQALLARRMGKRRVIAETGAGQHGVASATVAARYGMECVVYMGADDVKRQSPNVYRMKLLGATVVPVSSGSRTLKDALNEAMRDWVTNVDSTFYILGTAAGPHPYPMLVRDFQAIIGEECKQQMPELTGRQPDVVVACVGGGSNAIGIFYPYIDVDGVRLVGVEAAGDGIASGRHAAPLAAGRPGVLHGFNGYLMQDANGLVMETHSVSAGLDYPGVGPEHCYLKDSGRAEYDSVTDDEALAAFHDCCHLEGIIPALESSHALAWAARTAPAMSRDQVILVNLSGRGDKDINTVAALSGITL
ncbi:tryptophan synthase subunit beta [Paludibacterium yongneupense]|uniref:tryptophan synthase subunit beta n=1 Tax=Paludibacterium yongneupense TaxID=400061 RepID=UPI0003F86D03|nr:tryptophan synthase subunit beta [Paludibacterium yongneupense]